ncbi:hypothetical protein L9G74_06560 [Shewanella sp. C32]|uniref:Secreted protein n=1 Tax=Shewanella electrica TaxID=515560 RepID=A0ABT2FID7_9GAMM|nr:DUF6607 family protein [Shewanella electrica]MCH1924191.1 hypothetical protein [Shewanella electrica]MCS4556094.1 hypothetical protein [Shewanella electrica]
MYKKQLIQRMTIAIIAVMSLVISAVAPAKEQQPTDCANSKQFTFAWQLLDACAMKPRGGSKVGINNTLAPQPYAGWQSIHEANLSKFEQDRRAILAMAGPYRVSFDFLEIAGFTPDFQPTRPYQSWGTEYIYVAEDKGDFISLQHIMVMYYQQEDGSTSAPMVMKHWRQDWQYEKTELFAYVGHNKWQQQSLKPSDVKGTWAQAVYQVDDSPRYESYGQWQHNAGFSSWKSADTWRPLPRREGSVRDDYHVLEGTNRHTILPSGWVQEEENLKLVLDDNGQPAQAVPYLAKELGIARYERIVGLDYTPGDEYWKKTAPFWADVRYVWQQLIAQNPRMEIQKKVGEDFMFQLFFDKADEIAEGAPYDSAQGRQAIHKMLQPFIKAY